MALTTGLAGTAAAKPPPLKHVFIIVLENKPFDAAFGPNSEAPFLAKTLPSQGQLLPQYHAIAHLSNPNYIGMISGQGPNPWTQADCIIFKSFTLNNPAQPIYPGPGGQAFGSGCVYPGFVPTIADQITSAGLQWRGYMQDMGDDPARDGGTTCAHPAIDGQDRSTTAAPNDQYAARHNPFVYFHSILDGPYCNKWDVPLSRLKGDLQDGKTTANYSFIVPDLCQDAHDKTCADGGPGGLAASDKFLREWVPRIVNSPAFQQDGMLIVTFDEAPSSPGESEGLDSSACCNEATGPNSPSNGGILPGPGGGRVGAVVLSRFTQPGTVNDTPYNHYSMLRSVEDLFGFKHLGYAREPNPGAFGADVYNNTAGNTTFNFSSTTTTAETAAAAAPSGGCGSKPLYTPTAGRLPYGAVLNTVHILRRGRYRPFLRLIFDKPAATGILNFPPRRFRPGRQAPIRRLPLTRVAGCRAYHLLLPYVHGKVVLRVSPGTGLEGRSFYY